MSSALALFGVLAVGVVVGLVNGVVGGGSVISYPVMLATGLSPVTATITNSVGVSSANLFALAASLRRSRVDLRAWVGTAAASTLGAVIGTYLLLTLPAQIFDFAVPLLLLFASFSVLIKLPEPKPSDAPRPRHVVPNIFGSGIYCGYFGPGQGVMVLATLTHDGRLSSHEINVIKNFIIGVTGLATTTIFALSGHVAWAQAALLLVGSSIGGLAGGHYASVIPAVLFRRSIFTIGCLSAIFMGMRLL